MSCFDGLVGLKYACLNEGDSLLSSSSGLWLQNLKGFPGIKIADASLTEEDVSGVELIRECLNTAIAELSIQFRTHLTNKLTVNSIVDDGTAGIFNKDQKVKAAQSNYWRGIRAEIRKKSHFELFISTVSLLLNSVETIDVKVFNLATGQELDILQLTTLAGIPANGSLDKSYLKEGQRLDLFIGYLSTASSLNTTIPGCQSCRNNDVLRLTPAKILDSLPKTTLNIESATDTGGLSFNYSLNCSVEPFLCQSKNLFAWALVHKWGSNVMAEAVYGRRLHTLINVDAELNKALYEAYENEYMSSMSAVIDNITLPNDVCFKCRPIVRKVVQVP